MNGSSIQAQSEAGQARIWARLPPSVTAIDTPSQQALTLDRIGLMTALPDSGSRHRQPITHRFEPGHVSAITGPSGSGKTTLLSILALNLHPREGRLLDGNRNLLSMSTVNRATWRRRNVGFLLQPGLLNGAATARRCFEFAGELRQAPDAVSHGTELLERLDMAHVLDCPPADLTAWEARCVELARALCARPRMLLADDPTATLDGRRAARVVAELLNYSRARNAIVICASNDGDVVERSDTVLHLLPPM